MRTPDRRDCRRSRRRPSAGVAGPGPTAVSSSGCRASVRRPVPATAASASGRTPGRPRHPLPRRNPRGQRIFQLFLVGHCSSPPLASSAPTDVHPTHSGRAVRRWHRSSGDESATPRPPVSTARRPSRLDRTPAPARGTSSAHPIDRSMSASRTPSPAMDGLVAVLVDVQIGRAPRHVPVHRTVSSPSACDLVEAHRTLAVELEQRQEPGDHLQCRLAVGAQSAKRRGTRVRSASPAGSRRAPGR